MKATLSPDERDALGQQFTELASNPPFSTLSRSFLQQLATIDSNSHPIISLYLDLSPQSRLRDAWATHVKAMTQKAVAGLDDSASEAVERELERIGAELDERVGDMGRGVVFFVSSPLDLWQQIPLPLAFPNRLEVGKRPYLRPLLTTQDENARFAVVVMDERRARLFVSQLGSIQEVADIFEDTPKHHKQGGWSQMRFQRHHDAHVLWHAGAVAYATFLLMEKFNCRHLVVSGPPQALSEYRDHLPASVADRLAGEVNVPVDASIPEIAELIEPVQREAEADEELSTLREMQEASSVWGLADSLQALTEQRVMTLVVEDGYRAQGARCEQCGNLTSGDDTCASCGGELEETDDVVELALEGALLQDAELELVRSDRAREELQKLGASIGAHLRY